MASSCRPSYQVDSPRWVTSLAMMTARNTAPSSNPLNTRAIGNGPMTNDASTSTGATNRAIWAPDPTAMLTEMSILSREAKYTATQCSAALPTTATTITPTKKGDSPMAADASVMEWSRISDTQPTAAPAPASMSTLLRTDHGSPPCSSSSWEGLNRCGWVFRENTNPAAYEASSTTATPTDSACRSPGNSTARAVGSGSPPPATNWNIARITSATVASSMSDWAVAA